MPRLRLYDYPASGNCLKVRILLRHLGLEYERVHIDIFGGDTLSDRFRRINAARQVPVLAVGDHLLPESNAILWYLAGESEYLPRNDFARATVLRFLLFEQDLVGQIASLRFRCTVGLLNPADADARRLRANASRALDLLDQRLRDRSFLVGDSYSIADIAIYCYVHVAPEAGLDLDRWMAIRDWLARVEARPNFVNDLVPMPDTARVGRGRSIYG